MLSNNQLQPKKNRKARERKRSKHESEPAVGRTRPAAAPEIKKPLSSRAPRRDGPRATSPKPRREQPARLRGEDGAARQESRRQRAARGQRAQPLQVGARTLGPTPAAAPQNLDELHLAVQEVKRLLERSGTRSRRAQRPTPPGTPAARRATAAPTGRAARSRRLAHGCEPTRGASARASPRAARR